MAEKEERIFITTIDRAEDIDDFCVYGRDCMKRTEAIKRMADAISDAAKRSCSKKFVAEAALNALLEGKNEKENN